MSERHQIVDDDDFWTQLEYDATRWLARSGDVTLARLWIDGFVRESTADTQRGVDVRGTVWVATGSNDQQPFSFVVSVPQSMLHRRRRDFGIQGLSVDMAGRLVEITVISESVRTLKDASHD